MNRGLYTASVGMITQMNKMDVVANNIANVNTTGYKKDDVITRSFKEEMYLRVNDETNPVATITSQVGTLNLGNNVDVVRTDFTNGAMQSTEGNLDLAISGDGFFSINYVNLDGTITEKYTKNGSFTLGPNGELITHNGNQVIDESGVPIVLPVTSVPAIAADGSIFADGEFIAKIKITSFADTNELIKYGENLYDITDSAEIVPFTGVVEQGFLEMSNVNSAEEMVEMITVSRAYEACSKVIQTHDSIMSKTANDVGKK